MSAGKPKTKVVVRRLPPALTEEGFRQAVGKLLEQLEHDWFEYYPGKVSAKRVVFSRAYINFTNPDSVPEFKQAFDGHLFVGTKGNQYRCAVEYAPYQKTPVAAAKKDPRDGTIVKDPDYIEFLKLLEEGPEALPSASAQLEAQERAAAGATGEAGAARVTPLMEYLMEKYSANPNMKLGSLKRRKAREERDAAAAVAASVVLEAGKTVIKRRGKPDEPDAAPPSRGRDRAGNANGHTSAPDRAPTGGGGQAGSGAQQGSQKPGGRDGRGRQEGGAAAAAGAAAAGSAQGAGAGIGVVTAYSAAHKGPVVLLMKPKAGAGAAAGAGAGVVKDQGPASASSSQQPGASAAAGRDAAQGHGRGVDKGATATASKAQQQQQQQGDGHVQVGRGGGGAAAAGKQGRGEARGAAARAGAQQHAEAQGRGQPQGGAGKGAEGAAAAGSSRGATAAAARGQGAASERANGAQARGAADAAAADAGAAAAAAAAAAVLQRAMPKAAAAPEGGSGGGADDGGAGQRVRKVRAGFQAYVPGALRTGGRQAAPQGDSG